MAVRYNESAIGVYITSLCVFLICFYVIVCCFSVIWALLPEINVMMMIMMITFLEAKQRGN